MDLLLEYVSEEDDSVSEEDGASIQPEETICNAPSTCCHFLPDGNKRPVGSVNASDKSCSEDYFGLSETDNDDESNTSILSKSKIKPIKTGKKRSVRVGDVEVEIPDTSFWSDTSCSDVQTLNDSQSRTHATKKYRHSALHALGTMYGSINTRSPYMKRHLAQDNKSIARVKVKQEHTVLVRDAFDGERINNTPLDKVKTSKFGKEGLAVERKLFNIHPRIAAHLHKKENYSHIPRKIEKQLNAHNGVVNRVKWNCPDFSHLFLTTSLDTTVKIWNTWTQRDPCAAELRGHTKAVKDAEWSHCGRKILSCGYDKTALLTDVETGTILVKMHHESYATCCKFHHNSSLVLTGSHNKIQSWDTRTPNSAIKTFTHKDCFGQVHDLLFSRDGDEFFSCADLVSHDSADRNIIAWHLSSGAILSNQIYQERYTCTRLKLHPTEGQFMAQSNGNYIAIFSINRPYKMNKTKRFEGHMVDGYSIGFDVSSDGSLIFSGSSDGKLYCFNSQTGKLIRTLQTDFDICMDVALHPLLPSVIACCSWNGHVQVWH
ncbi:hypothetical protein ACJMK2_037248 [Sinanodonta woodiana]|uniref:WD repeat-containing protein 25 n=1 Tax=Sinanodonta woodiana TaxID=1069815 RepID=A0ABD3WJP7_SINWO